MIPRSYSRFMIYGSYLRQGKDHGTSRSYAKKHGPRNSSGSQGGNLTQKELGSLSGVCQETISRIEDGSSGTKLATVSHLMATLKLEITVTERSKSD